MAFRRVYNFRITTHAFSKLVERFFEKKNINIVVVQIYLRASFFRILMKLIICLLSISRHVEFLSIYVVKQPPAFSVTYIRYRFSFVLYVAINFTRSYFISRQYNPSTSITLCCRKNVKSAKNDFQNERYLTVFLPYLLRTSYE